METLQQQTKLKDKMNNIKYKVFDLVKESEEFEKERYDEKS